ncbi:hypothetical protein COB55_04435 [Candidatus Wolfebacteria bacterium]|nr:MAG: hypothetical protein COB55_04435 [Candidatus Wolfebacteria bacterium]
MNKKIWKYKIGDKVTPTKDFDFYGYKKGVKYTIIKEIYTSKSYVLNGDIIFRINNLEYYYEKPLEELFKKINTPPYKDGEWTDYYLIHEYCNREETLTNKELQNCRNLWEKYNKK